MNTSPIKVLSKPITIQTRRAQDVDGSLAGILRQVCTDTPTIAACHLLDSRRVETGQTALLVALVLDDEMFFETAALGFPKAFEQFKPPPEIWIISATSMAESIERYRGTEFYVRETSRK